MKNLFTSLFILLAVFAFGQKSKSIALLEIKPKIVQFRDKNYIATFDQTKCSCEKSLAKYRDQNGNAWNVYLNTKTEVIFYVKDGKMFKIEY